jgi:hypothetical protein
MAATCGARLPTLYIPHGGGPCFFMEWTKGPPDTWARTASYLRSIDPLMVAAGAGEADPGRVDFRDVVMGSVVSAIRFGEALPSAP